MSREIKKTVVAEKSVPVLLDVNFISDIPETTPAKKLVSKSELVLAKEDLTQSIEKNCRSVSSYFAELRKNHVKVAEWIKQAQAKNRRFDSAKVHDIINCGNLKPILEIDDILQAAKENKSKNWSANRLFISFVKAVEIKKTASPK